MIYTILVLSLFLFIILFELKRKAHSAFIDNKGYKNKEYKGHFFQLVSLKSGIVKYELCFGLTVTSPAWDFHKYTFTRSEFTTFINCLKFGKEFEHKSNGRSLRLVASSTRAEAVLYFSTFGVVNGMKPIDRVIIHSMVNDFELGVI